MANYIDKDALVAEIRRMIKNSELYIEHHRDNNDRLRYSFEHQRLAMCELLSFIDTLEVKEVNLYNNGWIDCAKQMPPETKRTSDTLQGHREWPESDMVLAWDSEYGCCVDVTKNGKWMSEERCGYTGQIIHGIIAWRPIPEFSEELLLKAQKGEEV